MVNNKSCTINPPKSDFDREREKELKQIGFNIGFVVGVLVMIIVFAIFLTIELLKLR